MNVIQFRAKRDAVLGLVVLLSVLYVPPLLNQFLSGRQGLAGGVPQTVEQLLRRLVDNATGLGLILFLASRFCSGSPIPIPRSCLKVDIPLALVLYCAGRTVMFLVATVAYGGNYRLGIALHSWEQTAWVFCLLTVTIAISAAYQEALLRWFLISRLEQLGVATWVAILSGAVLFGALHVYEGPLGVIDTALVGLLYGATFAYTRRLGAVTIAHFLWNMIIFMQIGHA